MSGLLHGDFGRTLTDNRSVAEILVTNGAATLELSFWALLVAFAVGIPLGRLAARYRDQFPDVVLRLFAILVYAAPVFFVGLLLKLAFTPFGWPSSGRASTSAELALDDVHPAHRHHDHRRHPVGRHRLSSSTCCSTRCFPRSRWAC